MIGADDRLALPRGVELRGHELRDAVRVRGIPVNATGRVVFAASTPRDAARVLERDHGVDARRALADVLSFCAELNGRFLLNVAPHGGRLALALRWLRAAPLLLPLGRAPAVPTVRRQVETRSTGSLARTAPRALGPAAATLAATGAGASALVLGAAGVAAPSLAAALGVSVSAAVALHESAHLVALRGVPACVVTRGLRVAVVHRAVGEARNRAIAASGPATGLAAFASLAAVLREVPSVELGAAAFVSLVNALGLTVATRDGRTLCGLR